MQTTDKTGIFEPAHAEMVGEIQDIPANLDLIYDQFILRSHESENAAYVGVAGNLNLLLLSEGNYKVGVLADLNDNQQLYWQGVVELLKKHDKLEDFKSDYNSRSKENYFYSPTGEAVIVRGVEATGLGKNGIVSCLEKITPEGYQKLHRMAVEDRLWIESLDLMNLASCQQLKSKLKENNLSCWTVYISNVGDFVVSGNDMYERPQIGGKVRFERCLKALADENTVVIDNSNIGLFKGKNAFIGEGTDFLNP